jgi:hypothetical protein
VGGVDPPRGFESHPLRSVSDWPPIAEPELLARLALDDRRFRELVADLFARLPPRAYEASALERALGYPWERPPGSYLLAGGELELLAGLSEAERGRALDRFASDAAGRLPLLAIGSNAAPETLERKFAHFPDERDRAVLALTGRLHDFDVGAAPQPALYGSLPATLFPSPGVEASVAVLWVTANQFTQLTWSELSYRLGRLRARFELDEIEAGFDEVLVFVSRWGAFCVEKTPVALAAIPARGRTASALTQRQLLDAAAALALGPGADAEALVRAIFEEAGEVGPRIAATVHGQALPFASEHWTPFVPDVADRGIARGGRDRGSTPEAT